MARLGRTRGREYPCSLGVRNELPRERAERGRPVLDQLYLSQHLIGSHSVPLPGAAARGQVLEHRLEPVKRPGELRLAGQTLVELIPELPEDGSLVGREDCEDPVGGGTLGNFLPPFLVLFALEGQTSTVH